MLFFVVFVFAAVLAAVGIRGHPGLRATGTEPGSVELLRSSPVMGWPASWAGAVLARAGWRPVSAQVWLERSPVAWWLAGFVLVLLVGLREGTSDLARYALVFRYLADEPGILAATDAFRDPGWGALNYVISRVWDDPRALFITVAVMSVGGTLYCYRRMAPYFFVAVLGYIAWSFTKDLGQMRNGLCSTIVLFSLLKLYERRCTVWPATVGLAASVHAIGLIGFMAPVFRRLGDSRLMVAALLSGGFVAVLGGGGEWLGELVAEADQYWRGSLLSCDLRDTLGCRIQDYLGTDKSLEPYRLFGGSMSLTLLVAAVVLALRGRLEAVSRYNTLLIPVLVYGCVLFLLFRDFPTLAFRIRDTLVEPAEPILLSSVVAAGAPWQRPWLLAGVVGYCGLWYFAEFFSNDWQYGIVLFGAG